MTRLQFEVAGIKYRIKEYVKAEVARGDALTLKPEPTNKFDPNAIAIYKGEAHIGYVPRSHNHVILEDLKHGMVTCHAKTVWPGGCWVVVSIREPADEIEGDPLDKE